MRFGEDFDASDENMESKHLPVNNYNMNTFQDDDSHVIAPPRSHLYCLKPIGMGTAFVECLTSYLSRLAQEHSVHLQRLIVEELFPIYQRAYLPSRCDNNNLTAFWKDSAALNSTNPSTRDWIQTIEKLTLRSDLRYLTMLTWSNVLSPRNLLRRSKAWCSTCYREWCESGTQVYEPLLWMLEVVTICTRHDCYLEIQCVNHKCKRHLSMLASQTQLGYCNYCGCWLGELTGKITSRVPSEDELKWQKWLVEAVGELLATAPTLSGPIGGEIFSGAVAELLNITFDGNVSALARRLRVSRRTIRDWVKGVQIPQIDSLLHFCYLCQVSPLQLFEKSAAVADCIKQDIEPSPELKQKIKKHPSIFPAEYVRSALEAELLAENNPPRPMSAVAKSLNYDQSFLHKHFPDLCCAVSDRYRAYQKKQRMERQKRILDEVQRITHRVYKQGLYPSQERVRRLLTKPGSIKEPGALAVWHQALRELGVGNKEP
jgi:transcriptional regulator with XRE-family HTH domain